MKQRQKFTKSLVITILLIFFVSSLAYSQTESIAGTVKDAKSGLGIPGVNILIQGTTDGAVTDLDGNFSLKVSNSTATLIISSIGYVKQNIALNGRTTLDVLLEEESINLNELIVVGYNSKTKTEISSSVVSLNSDQLAAATASAMDGVDLLQGRVAGLTIMESNYGAGQPPAVRIRGTGSISASSEPLWVVDGVISSSNAFNPNDVESMTVMKDAGATGIYGSKAAGGVIVVTTKSGKAGKPKFNANVSYGITKPWWGNFEGIMNSAQIYDYYHQAFMNDNLYLPTATNTEALFQSSVMKGKTRDEVLATDFDWLNALYPKGSTAKLDFSYSGGNDKTTQYISLNYNKSDGTLRGNNEDRISGTIRLTNKLTDKFKIDAKVYASMRNINYPVMSENVRYAPFDSPYNEDGSLKTPDDVIDDWIGTKATNQLYHEEIGNELSEEKMSFIPNLNLSYQILPNLSIASNTKYSYNSTMSKDYMDGRSYANDQNPNLGVLGTTNAFVKRTQSTGVNLLNNEIITYSVQFENHSFNVLGGFEYQQQTSDGFSASNTGLVPGIDVLNATSGLSPIVKGTPNEIYRLSYFSQLNYDFSKKYFLTVSYRRDGSSKFGSDNRYGNFYSGSASWLVSNEDFMQSMSDVINNLKFRTSYGATGNDDFPNYTAVETYSLSGADYNGVSGAAPTQYANPDLTWEKANTINIGLDLGLWKKLDLTFDYYHIKNTDILYQVPIDPTTGFDYAWQNIGDVLNKGFEFSASGNILEGKDFIWFGNLTFAYNYNEVLALTEESEIGIIDIKSDKILKVGEDVNSVYALDYIGADPETGLATWNTQDANGNINGTTHWKLDPNIAHKTENMSPRYTAGFNNKFSYKGFGLDIMISYVGGFYTNISNNMWFRTGEKVIQGQSSAVLNDTWQKPGDNAYFPQPFYGVYGTTDGAPNKPEGINVVKGDYIKLNYIALTYDLPKSYAKMLKVSNLSIFTRFENPYLYAFDKHFTFSTPEAGGYGGTEVGGTGVKALIVNNRLRPVMQNLVFGINVSF